MIATSTPFAVMIEGVEQWYAWQVGFGGVLADVYPDLTLAVTSIELEATDNNSTVPDQSRYQSGIPDMTGTLVLDGMVDPTDASKTAAWLFRRWNPDSPLKGLDALQVPVTIDLGVTTSDGPETIRKATMWVDDYTTNKDGTVTFSLKDRWSTLRALPRLAAVVTQAPFNAGLTSEFAIDFLLRAASGGAVSSWPAQRAHCVLAAGMRASLYAEVGTLFGGTTLSGSSYQQTPPTFDVGVNGSGLLLPDSSTDLWNTLNISYAWTLDSGVGTDWLIELDFTGLKQGTNPATGNPYRFVLAMGQAADLLGPPFTFLQVDHTGITVVCESATGDGTHTWTHAVDDGDHHLMLQINWPFTGTTFSGSVQLDSTSHTIPSTSAIGTRSSSETFDLAYISSDPDVAVISGLQVTTETSGASSNFGFVPQAVIGPSLNPLQVVPLIEAQPDSTNAVRDAIQQIAAAELGLPYFDESGIFHFRNRRDIRTDITVARTITSATALADIDEETIAAAVINRARPGYTGWNFGAAAQLWSLSKVWRIPAKSTVTKIVNAPSGTLWCNIDTDVALLPDSGVATAGNSYYRASTDAAGRHNHPGLTIVPTLLTSTQLQIEITNDHGIAAYTAASADNTDPDAGTPVLIIGGVPVTADDEVQVDFQYPPKSVVGSNGLRGTAGTRFGEVPWDDTGNPWRQDPDATLQLAQDVVCDACVPRPNLNNITLAFPDFRLQLADLVGISDLDRTLIVDYARIFGWTINFSATERSMVIDGRTLAAPFGWIGGLAGRSEGGTTTIGFSGAA